MQKLSEIKVSYSNRQPASERKTVKCSDNAAKYLREVFEPGIIDYREMFYILCLNRSNKVLGFSQISVGGISGTISDIRIIFQTALKSNSSALIVCHNHPSGNLNPSQADKTITKKLVDAGKLLDISVLDHVILTEESYYSFADNNLI